MINQNAKKAEVKGLKAIPFLKLVQQFAFLNDLPFTFWKDQRAAITLYCESLKQNAA